MSFSSDVKTELSKLNNLKNKNEVLAELVGYLKTANVNISDKNIKFATENEYNINRFAKLLNNVNINDYKIDIQGKTYSITFKNTDLNRLQIITNELTDNEKKAYIRGAFLGSGSVNNPKNKYHLEILFDTIKNANIVYDLLDSFNIKTKILSKTKLISLYIKEGEEISNFLALIGASSSVLKFEEIRVMRDMKNNVNRIVNCETANLNKTISASVEQISCIKQLKKSGKFSLLPDDLKEIANLREKNPDATLEELGNMLQRPISKSSVSHRFKKLKEYN